MLIYQVYPRSCQDSDGDGVGDLRGLLRRLPHVASLGVDVLWLGPVFRSPMEDFGYDVSDYRSVDPVFGTLDDLSALVASARELGLRVMLDMVVSHTSDRHPWFDASRRRAEDRDDWYLWADPRPDGTPPNNWMSVFGGGAWEWDAQRRQYYFHSFLASQPDLNFHHPAVQEQLLDEMRWWLELGIAGFRLDACNHYFQDRALRDNPPVDDASQALHPYGFQKHLYDRNRPEVPRFLGRVRALLDRYGATSLGEIGGADGWQVAADYLAPGCLHSAYSFDLLRAERSAAFVRGVLERIERVLGAPGSGLSPGPPPARVKEPGGGPSPLERADRGGGQVCHALSNHDKPRVVTRWGAGRERAPFARQMLALLACLRGNVCLYQGEELGLPEADVPADRLRDPYGRRFWPRFKGRDGCRTPMPWDASAHAGFTTGEPWLPVDPVHLALNVAAQEADPDSVLHFARRVFGLRRERAELADGAIEFTGSPDEVAGDVLRFERRTGDGALECVFQLGDGDADVGRPPGPVLLARQAHDGDARLGPCGLRIAERRS
jgi:alpha-glucosidase